MDGPGLVICRMQSIAEYRTRRRSSAQFRDAAANVHVCFVSASDAGLVQRFRRKAKSIRRSAQRRLARIDAVNKSAAERFPRDLMSRRVLFGHMLGVLAAQASSTYGSARLANALSTPPISASAQVPSARAASILRLLELCSPAMLSAVKAARGKFAYR